MKILKHTIIILLVVIMLFPVLFVIVGATNNSGWAFELPFSLTFGDSFLDNYLSINNEVFDAWNSLMISFITSILITIISTIVLFMASYALTKFEFKYKNIAWVLFITLSLIPETSYLIGRLDIINRLGLYSTFLGLVLPFLINLRVLIYMKGACSYIPNQILKAGRIEGASEWTIMCRIAAPHIKDKLGMASFLLFVSSWNNFLIPMIITSDSKLFNLPMLISSLADPMRYNIGGVFMALLFSILPIIIVFILTSRWLYIEEK